VKEAPSTTSMQALVSSAVDTRLHQPAFDAMLESVPAPQREAFRASAQRQLVDAAVFQSVQRQADDWLAEHRYYADSAQQPDAAARLGKWLRSTAGASTDLKPVGRPQHVALVEAAQQRAVAQAERRLAAEAAEQQRRAAADDDQVHVKAEEAARVKAEEEKAVAVEGRRHRNRHRTSAV
jgi:hypothetical protein